MTLTCMYVYVWLNALDWIDDLMGCEKKTTGRPPAPCRVGVVVGGWVLG